MWAQIVDSQACSYARSQTHKHERTYIYSHTLTQVQSLCILIIGQTGAAQLFRVVTPSLDGGKKKEEQEKYMPRVKPPQLEYCFLSL